MTECAICGHTAEGEHVATVTVEWTDPEHGRADEYLLHEWCAERVFGGWRKP